MATARPIGRLMHQTFGISAPRMAIRTELSWRWKLPALAGLLSLIAGMWWLGFDFGQFLSGFNRSVVAQTQARLESELRINQIPRPSPRLGRDQRSQTDRQSGSLENSCVIASKSNQIV